MLRLVAFLTNTVPAKTTGKRTAFFASSSATQKKMFDNMDTLTAGGSEK
jgi:hypothetical protein